MEDYSRCQKEKEYERGKRIKRLVYFRKEGRV